MSFEWKFSSIQFLVQGGKKFNIIFFETWKLEFQWMVNYAHDMIMNYRKAEAFDEEWTFISMPDEMLMLITKSQYY